MQASTRRWIQVFLAVALLAASLRVLWIFYQRSRPLPKQQPKGTRPARRIHPDFFVYLPRSFVTDFDSARTLKGAALWVRDGWRYPHFPFHRSRRRSQEIPDPPALGPLQKITVTDTTLEPARKPGVYEVNLIFESPEHQPAFRSVTVGYCDRQGRHCRFFVDDMFFLKDPRALYSHWPPDVWRAIERHEVQAGMSETQIFFALGSGRLLLKETAEAGGDRVLEFRPPRRPPVVVTFGSDGNARGIR